MKKRDWFYIVATAAIVLGWLTATASAQLNTLQTFSGCAVTALTMAVLNVLTREDYGSE